MTAGATTAEAAGATAPAAGARNGRTPAAMQVPRDTALTTWPSPESITTHDGDSAGDSGRHPVRTVLLAALIATLSLASSGFDRTAVEQVTLVCGMLLVAFVMRYPVRRCAAERRLLLCTAAFAAQVAVALVVATVFHSVGGAMVLLCSSVVFASQWLPLLMPIGILAVTAPVLITLSDPSGWKVDLLGLVACLLGGYGGRQKRESRARAARQVEDEKATLRAERETAMARAESAALEERARIARDIHDVLAHSLSAQIVHLEVARLMLERGDGSESNRDQVLERISGARTMARRGLEETREALTTLRGDAVPVAEQITELARADGAELRVTGTARPLPAPAGQAVRRAAQEALTNIRKHAPGAPTTIELGYTDEEVTLTVTNSARPSAAPGSASGSASGTEPGPGDPEPEQLARSGSGYGLVGMRERAELLGGTLDAGPTDEGFRVCLTLPTG